MTFNAANDLVKPADLIAMIGRSGADVIGLQELSPRNSDSLAASLHEDFPYRIVYGKYFDGKGLLSRHPMHEYERLELPSGRSSIAAQLEIDHRGVSLFVVHPPPANYRRLEVVSPLLRPDIEMVLSRASLGRPTLLIGDLNLFAGSSSYRLLQQVGLIDTFREAGHGAGLTFPVRGQRRAIPLPRLVRIDYIWATTHFLPLLSWVGSDVGSDHLPVISALALLSG